MRLEKKAQNAFILLAIRCVVKAYVELLASIERFCSFVLFYIYDSNSNILRPKGVLLLLNILTKRSTPFTLEGVPKMTKMNIYYSFCSIF